MYINKDCIPNLQKIEKRRHDIIGYGSMIDNHYTFYSIEDNYSHGTENIVNNYDNHSYWILIKTHPCNLYTVKCQILNSKSLRSQRDRRY